MNEFTNGPEIQDDRKEKTWVLFLLKNLETMDIIENVLQNS